MKNLIKIMAVVLAVPLFTNCERMKKETESTIIQPVAEKVEKELTAHGDVRIDNYYWMRLSDEQKNDKTPDEQTQKV
ncbi:MAG: hypothetical protein KAI99_23020, partial [Cyclobacteriaceae bacterium]|nr:hypothetical protein [Cyclobacteriaceae bacterium]